MALFVAAILAVSTAARAECTVKTLVGSQAHSVCRADGYWHVVGVSYFCIPGDGVETRRDFDRKTRQKCEYDGPKVPPSASLAELMLQILMSALKPLDETCQAPTAVGEIAIDECVGGFWEQATYERYQCLRPEDEIRIARPAKHRTRTTTPCTEKPPPLVTGAHDDPEEVEGKAASRVEQNRKRQ